MATTREFRFKTQQGGIYTYKARKVRGNWLVNIIVSDDTNTDEFGGLAPEQDVCAVYGEPAVGHQFRVVEYVNQGELVKSYATSEVIEILEDEDEASES
jgi:hypothetical protein